MRKSKSVKVSVFALDIVLIVANVETNALPTSILLGKRFRVYKRFHATIVQAVSLHQVYNVKLILDFFPHIGHCKVEPLRVSACVDIKL